MLFLISHYTEFPLYIYKYLLILQKNHLPIPFNELNKITNFWISLIRSV